MSAPPFMPFFVTDYLGDTMHLSRDQHGAYLLLIFAYWRNGGPIPDDENQLSAITKASQTEWQTLRPVIAPFFRITRGLWHHKRIDVELNLTRNKSEARSKAGGKGAAKRWQNHSKTIVTVRRSESQSRVVSKLPTLSSGDKNLPHRAPASGRAIARGHARGGGGRNLKKSAVSNLWEGGIRAAEAMTERQEAAANGLDPHPQANQPLAGDQRDEAAGALPDRRRRSGSKATRN